MTPGHWMLWGFGLAVFGLLTVVWSCLVVSGRESERERAREAQR